jgi:hypothetical protein
MRAFEIRIWDGDDAGWDGMLGAFPTAPMQAFAAYGGFARRCGRRVRRVLFQRAGGLVGMAQVLGRGAFWLLSHGPVFAEDLSADERRHLLRRLARLCPGVLVATLAEPVSGFGLVPLVTPRHHVVWDLTPEPEVLRAALAGKWRNRLCAAERAGLRITADPDPVWLLEAEAAQRKARGYRALPPALIADWAQARPGDVWCLRAERRNGPPCAGIIVLRHGTGARYQIGWSGEEGRRLGAHNRLLWDAAMRLRRAGVRRFDLGDVNSEAGAGLMHFKRGTGARLDRLGATVLVLPG